MDQPVCNSEYASNIDLEITCHLLKYKLKYTRLDQ